MFCSTDQGGNTAIINLNDYASFTGEGTASFSANGPIADPDAYLATNGDVVTYTVENTPICTSSATFTITVNDKQSFGICAPGQGKTFGLIGSELTSLYEIFNAGGQPVSSEVFLIQGNNVLIEVNYLPNKLSELLPILISLGFVDQIPEDEVSMTIAGFFPIMNLLAINELVTTVNQARPGFPPVPKVGTTTTQGDRALRSDLVRLGYDLTGEGTKVCILSDSYNTLLAAEGDVTSGDLPGIGNPFGHVKPVQVLQEYPWGTGSDEGRAMAQIVHDIAPEAELFFRTAFITAGDFAAGIRQSQAAGCSIIVDDVTYYTEEYYKDGKVALAVDEVAALGVSYFTAAGNFGHKSHEGIFTPMTINGLEAHDFGGGDPGQSITLGPLASGAPATYTIVLQWDDPVGTENDLDLYLSEDQGITRFGFNRVNIGRQRIEVLTRTVRSPLTTDIMVVRAEGSTGTANVKFKYIVFRGDNIVFNEHDNGGNGFSTIVGQANAQGAMTVGAILYSNTPEYGYARPAGSEEFGVASFSSVGGTTTNGVVRLKPDFIAPNGVNTTVFLGGQDVRSSGFTRRRWIPQFLWDICSSTTCRCRYCAVNGSPRKVLTQRCTIPAQRNPASIADYR